MKRQQRCKTKSLLRIAPQIVALCAVCTLLPDIALARVAPPQIGTLFYSPAERADIEAGRDGSMAQATGRKSLTLRGLVHRDRSKGTTWINGQTVPEGQGFPSAGVPVIGRKSVTIDSRSLRVGETLDVDSGTRSDYLRGGTVERRK